MKYEQKLLELVRKNDRVMVMTAENRAPMRNIIPELGDHFVDTGITEQTLVGSAAGLALRGRIPVAHALTTFLTMRAFEFIRTDVALANLPVKLVGFVPGFLSEANGPTHQAIEDIALMRAMPNMQIFCPADEGDLLTGMEQVILTESPAYIRYNIRPSVVEHAPFQWGKAEVFGEGNSEVTLLTYGTLFTEAYQAWSQLCDDGVSCKLVHMRSLRPFDEKAIIDAAKSSQLVVTLEDHFLTGGLFSIVSETLCRNQLSCSVLPLGLDGVWFKPALLKDVLEFEGFTGPKIAEKIYRHFKSLGAEK